MKTPYDKVTPDDGKTARDRLLAKVRPPDPSIRDIARMNRMTRTRPKASEWQDLVPDTTEN